MISPFGYQLTEKIHESSKSVVFRAIREADGVSLIVKMPADSGKGAEANARLKYEYELLSQLRLEGVIEAVALERAGESVALVTADFGGRSLRAHLRETRFDFTQGIEMALEIARILGRVHQAGVVHMDVNPANLVWNRETSQVRLIDFGIASRLAQLNIGGKAQLEGSLAYISPEQTGRMNCGLDYRTDYYSLGVTLYELFTGRLPFTHDDPMACVHAHIALLPEPPTRFGVPFALSQILLKLMAKSAGERYQSSEGLIADLGECLEQLSHKGCIEAFELGRSDAFGRFCIPEKLYGRESQIRKLYEGYQKSECRGSLMLVRGMSGIGKTSLVQELYKPVTEHRGFFVSGKFDLLQRQTPYSAFIQSFSQLIQQILGLEKAPLDSWRARLQEAVGDNGAVIVDAIPDLKLLIGEQPAVPELPPVESENRFRTQIERFVRALASPESPLAIFVDDLQWADVASLNLLKQIALDGKLTHFYLVCAFREGEIDEIHPLTKTLHEIRAGGGKLDEILLQPLAFRDVLALLEETLHSKSPELEQLAALCLRKSGGNPFYLQQFLRRLYDESLIRLSDNRCDWSWNLEEIERLEASDDMGALMAVRLARLPESTRALLRQAACFGNRFELSELARVVGQSPSQCMKRLWDALQLGLVMPNDHNWRLVEEEEEVAVTFSFLHDRVQQAAYALFHDDLERRQAHLAIGNLLAERRDEEQLFAMVDQLNKASNLLRDSQAIAALAHANQRVGQKALDASAYQAALAYFEKAVELHGENCWDRDPEIAYKLYQRAATAAYSCGNFEASEAYIARILTHARTFEEKWPALEIRLQGFFSQKRFKDAMQVGLAALAEIGFKMPLEAGKPHVLWEVFKTRFALRNHSLDRLLQMPLLEGNQVPLAMRIVRHMGAATMQTAPMLYFVMNCKMLRYSLKRGNSPQTAFCFVLHGQLLGSIFLKRFGTSINRALYPALGP